MESYEGKTVAEAISDNEGDRIQLGCIAQDIKDDKLFKFISAENKFEIIVKEVEPAQVGEIEANR